MSTARQGTHPFRLWHGLVAALVIHQAVLLGLMLWLPSFREGMASVYPLGPRPLTLVFVEAVSTAPPEPAEQEPPPAARNQLPPLVQPTPEPVPPSVPLNLMRGALRAERQGAEGPKPQTVSGTEGARMRPFRAGRLQEAAGETRIGAEGRQAEPAAEAAQALVAPDASQESPEESGSTPLEAPFPLTDEAFLVSQQTGTSASEQEQAPSAASDDSLVTRAAVEDPQQAVGPSSRTSTTAAAEGEPASRARAPGSGASGTGEYAVIRKGKFKRK